MNIKKESHISIIISVSALLISFLGIWFQFFWQSHNLSTSVYNVVGPLKNGELSADIVFVNRGNQDEVVMSAYFVFDDQNAKVSLRSAEQLGPMVIRKGEANTFHLSAKINLRELVFEMSDFSGHPERYRQYKHEMHQGVVFDIVKSDGAVVQKLFPLLLIQAIKDKVVELSESRDHPKTFITLLNK
jgi:hypothetical protein